MQQGVNNHSMGMRSYLLKNIFKCNLQKHHFVYIYEIIIKCYLNFITCLYFPRALIRWHSSHCHLMELFKSKESFKEKFDSSNNWKTTWSRMILEWHPFFKKNIKVFTQKMSVYFLYFLFKWKGVKTTSVSNAICRKCNFCDFFYIKNVENSTPHKKEREKEKQKHNPTSKTSISKLLKNFH